MKTISKFALAPVAAAGTLAATAANAAGTGTLADLSAAVDFSDVKTAMIAVAVSVVGVLVLWFGIRKVKRSIG